MKFVVFGLTMTSSWGNGHATLWRGLCRALGDAGHEVVFFERDVPYYAAHRDATRFAGCDLRLYEGWSDVAPIAAREVAGADAAIVTSYCIDARVASDVCLTHCQGMRVFYDLDTPITLEKLEAGEPVAYLPEGGLSPFDLVLSFTGGRSLEALRTRLGARRVAPLYGSADPTVHRPGRPDLRFASDLAYLGTYAADRREAVDNLFLEPARRLPHLRFLLAGALYPADVVWPPNVRVTEHVAPGDHAALFASCRASLNVTRRAMARWGFCPSGRLFEAALCGAAQITDMWDGLDAFFEPGSEIFVARSTEDVLSAVHASPGELERVGLAAQRRALESHTSAHRARQLVALVRGEGADRVSDLSRKRERRDAGAEEA
jgi:spore maturation protein CgeB